MSTVFDRSRQKKDKRRAELVAVIFLLLQTVITSVAGFTGIGFGYIVMVPIVLLLNRVETLRAETDSWFVPLSLSFVATAFAIRAGGDVSYFTFLLGCGVISLSYLSHKGLLIYTALSNFLIVTVVFVMGIDIMGRGASVADNLRFLLSYDSVSALLFWLSFSYSVKLKALEASSRTFEIIMETTPNYMVISNEGASVDYISDSLAKWLGISHRQYAQQRPLLDLFPTGDMKMMFQDVMEHDGYVEKNFEVKIGDKPYWFVLHSSLMGSDKISRFYEWWDITPIMEAKNEAESAARAKSDFLATISHEIRTPMNAIIGMTELMLANRLEPEQDERAKSIWTAAISLLEIVNDILDFSKIDAKKMEIISRPFEISTLVKDTVNMINIKANEAGIAFVANVSNKIPPMINGDELRIKQVLLNLLSNAVKFTKEGVIALEAWHKPLSDGIELHFSVYDTGIGIREEDIGKLFGVFNQLDTRKNRRIVGTGLGLAITKRLVEMMGGSVNVESVYGEWTRFSFFVVCRGLHIGKLADVPNPETLRALCYETNQYNADALGKMLGEFSVPHDVCTEAERAHELLSDGDYTHVLFDGAGKDAIEVFRGRPGTRFILLKEALNKNESDFDGFINRPVLTTTLADALSGRDSISPGTKKSDDVILGAFQVNDAKVLVIDDNQVNLEVAEGLLRKYGIDVETAMSGQDALEKVKNSIYDIIFMDHMMPGMDGIDVTKAIRAMRGRHFSDVIIALTANATPDAQKQFRLAGMNDFLPKPIMIPQLQDVLLRHLPREKIKQPVKSSP
jgi:signal transduction histidine kinase/CheY-like chemotaxis protein